MKFQIVDRAQAYFIGSKGKGLQPRSFEVMDDFGIIDQVWEAAFGKRSFRDLGVAAYGARTSGFKLGGAGGAHDARLGLTLILRRQTQRANLGEMALLFNHHIEWNELVLGSRQALELAQPAA